MTYPFFSNRVRSVSEGKVINTKFGSADFMNLVDAFPLR